MTKLKRVSAWVEKDVKYSLQEEAQRIGLTESRLLTLLIVEFLKKDKNVNPGFTKEITSEIKTNRVTSRFTDREYDSLIKMATQKGMQKGSYLSALFRTLLVKQPYFSNQELLAFREANRELAAIGRNINQIAKALNTSLDNADRAYALEISALRMLVDEHRKFVKQTIKENMQGWRISNE